MVADTFLYFGTKFYNCRIDLFQMVENNWGEGRGTPAPRDSDNALEGGCTLLPYP